MSHDNETTAAADVWRELTTESRHPGSHELDRLPSRQVAELILDEDRLGIDRAKRQLDAIASAAERLASCLDSGGQAVLVGAGTSGRLGVIEAAECPPTFGTDPESIRAVIAGGDEAVFRAREGAEDQAERGRQVGEMLSTKDLLIGISASSVTPYVLGAIEAARERGASTVLLTCAAPSALFGVADLLVALDTGPEVLTGSTRLKAGSATKATLNAITTTAMVRLGKTFGNLMVDLRPGSAKLVDRSRRIVEAALGIEAKSAATLLEEASGEVKTAIVAGRLKVNADEARERLSQARGHVRQACETE